VVTFELDAVRFFDASQDLRDWFDENHATTSELWLGYHKVGSGRPSVSWSDAVDEALCVGWIDGIVRRIDDDSYAQRFTPRRAGSTWSSVNVAKVGVLIALGQMRPAGMRAFEARTVERTGIYSYEGTPEALSDDELERFRAETAAWKDWESRPPSYRKAAIHWVTTAKGASTRERRLAALIEDSLAGRPIKPLAWTRKGA
jgi:uncharacterized protein YdeI (YjbR/CyaY-like superfamily)